MPKVGARSNNPEGRPAGSRNKRTIEWERLGGFITEAGAERVMAYLNSIEDDREFFDKYERLLNYFKPKMSAGSIEHTGNAFDSVTINLKKPE